MLEGMTGAQAARRQGRGRSGGVGWLRLLGVLILLILLWRIDVRQTARLVTSADPRFLVAAILMTIPVFAVRSWRWRLILRALGVRISGGQAFQLYGAGLFAGQATPGQLGEFVRAYFLQRRGQDGLLATSSVVVDRALDLFVLAIVAAPALGLLFGTGPVPLLGSGALAGLAAWALVRGPGWLRRFGAVTAPGRGPELLRGKLAELLRSVGETLRTPAMARAITAATVLAVGLNLLRFYLLLVALGVTLPALTFVCGVTLANLAGLLPITVAGVGIRDAVLVLIFQQAGQPAEAAIAYSLLILVVAYGLNVVWGFPAWLLENRGHVSGRA